VGRRIYDPEPEPHSVSAAWREKSLARLRRLLKNPDEAERIVSGLERQRARWGGTAGPGARRWSPMSPVVNPVIATPFWRRIPHRERGAASRIRRRPAAPLALTETGQTR
jgi:hypothetical protein